MTIQVFRDGQLVGNFEENSIGEGLASGRLRTSDEYFFDGMSSRRSLADFLQASPQTELASDKPKKLIRVHNDPARSRRESKRNDKVILGVLAVAILVGFGVFVYKDVTEKKERRRQAEREQLQKYMTSTFPRKTEIENPVRLPSTRTGNSGEGTIPTVPSERAQRLIDESFRNTFKKSNTSPSSGGE